MGGAFSTISQKHGGKLIMPPPSLRGAFLPICHQNQAKNDVLVADFFGRSCPPSFGCHAPPLGGAFKIFGACGAILSNLTFLLTKLAKISECPPTRGGHCHQMTKSATNLGGTCHQLGGSALPTWGGALRFLVANFFGCH